MTEPRHALDPSKAQLTARVIHGAVAAGVALVFVIFLYLGTVSSPMVASETGRTLRLAAFVLLFAVIIMTRVMKGRITPPPGGADIATWWGTNLPKAIVVWGVAEGGALAVMILGFLAGDRMVLVVGAAVGLSILFFTRPGSLQGRTYSGPIYMA